MLTLPPTVRVFVWSGRVDLRRSIDGLSAIVTREMGASPLSGHLFVFANRRRDRIKILFWDRSGYWVLYKRLERGTFAWTEPGSDGVVEMRPSELSLLLDGFDPLRTARRRWYDRSAA